MSTFSMFGLGAVCAAMGVGLFVLGLAFAGLLAVKLWWKW